MLVSGIKQIDLTSFFTELPMGFFLVQIPSCSQMSFQVVCWSIVFLRVIVCLVIS